MRDGERESGNLFTEERERERCGGGAAISGGRGGEATRVSRSRVALNRFARVTDATPPTCEKRGTSTIFKSEPTSATVALHTRNKQEAKKEGKKKGIFVLGLSLAWNCDFFVLD